ncbi:MAG: hypothetical protein ACYCZJ_04605 [Sulfuriferula sp.]
MNEHYIGIEQIDTEQEQANPSYAFEQTAGRAIEHPTMAMPVMGGVSENGQ